MPRTTLLVLQFIALFAVAAEGSGRPTVDDIVDRHLAARGGRQALAAIRTLVYGEGLYQEEGFTSPGDAFMAFARPYYRVVGYPPEPGTYLEGYDGAAWEWYADPGIVVRTVGAAAGATRRGADFEGPFVDYRAKGSTIVLGEPEEIAGRGAWQLVVTLRDGFERRYFVDQETLLVIAERRSAPIHAFGDPVTTETRIGDYRRVAGVLFAHSYVETEIATGQVLSRMQWGRIEADRELPASWFSPPEFERTPLQRFLEHLYAQRTDRAAVMWSYHEFRRAHPGVDTRAGVEAVGYQMLKMGEVETAVALLQANAADHPDSSSAAFGLGRAYQAAGRADAARREHRRALLLNPEYERAQRALQALRDAPSPPPSPGFSLEGASDFDLHDPAWDPTGDRVAFYANPGGNFDVFVLDLRTQRLTRVTRHPAQDANPAWSPDGAVLSFTSDRDGSSEIYLLELSSGEIRRLTQNDADEAAHRWAPSGAWIATEREVAGNHDLYLVAADGRSERRLTRHEGRDFRPTWCAGGKRIVFQSRRGDSYRLYSIRPEGDGLVQLTGGDGHQAAPACAPRSGRIAYVHHDAAGKSSIWVADGDGGDPLPLTADSGGSDLAPSWSPDESQIVFISERDGSPALYRMAADGTQQQPIQLP